MIYLSTVDLEALLQVKVFLGEWLASWGTEDELSIAVFLVSIACWQISLFPLGVLMDARRRSDHKLPLLRHAAISEFVIHFMRSLK